MPLLQHRPENPDAADGLAVEALGQHHAVGEDARRAPVEPRNRLGPFAGRHVAADHLGRMACGAEGLGDRGGVIDGGAEEDGLPVGGLLLPVLDHGVGQNGPVQHPVGRAHVVVPARGVDAGEFIPDAEIDGEGPGRHEQPLRDQCSDPHLIADIAEGLAQTPPIAAAGRSRKAKKLDIGVQDAGLVDDRLIARGRGAVAFVDDEVRAGRHALATVGAGERLDAAEDDAPAPVVLLGLHHRGGEAGDRADGRTVLLDQLVGVLQDQNPVLPAIVEFLADAEAGDGGLARPGGQNE